MSDKKVIPIGGGSGGESIIVDDALSTTSTNPVQNKVITNALNNKANKSTTIAGYGITNAYTKTEVDTSLSVKANNADLSTVAKTGQYSDIKGKPSALPADGGDSATVNGHTVESDVPANAKFTDTVYTHPSTHAASMITGLSTVATSGSYSDLSNKPTIPSIPSSLPANGGNADTVGGFTVGTNVPADAKFTDTVYTLPAATTSALGGVKVGTNISVSSGTISVANGSTSTKGVVQLTNSTSSTSTTTAATPASVKSAYDLANGKQSPATTLSGYGITDAYTKTEVDNKVAGLVDSAPEALNTLNELAAALGDDPNFATTMSTAIGKKANSADLAKVATSGSYNDLSNKPTIPTSLPANGGNAATVGGFTVGVNVPANAKFTDTIYELPNATSSVLGGVKIGSNITVSSGTISLSKSNVTSALGYTPPTSDTTYSNASTSSAGLMSASDKTKLDGIASGANAYTLPNATSSTLGGVKIGTNISVSSGTISVANASTSAKGVVQLSSATNSTSTSLAATASAVKSAYDLANGKQSPATTLAGYGITNAYTKTETESNFLGWNRGAYDVDTLVNAGIYMIASGSNAPSGSQYGSLLTMPYRSLTGNSTPDFGTQIFIPNGDDKTKPNSMFFRTSLSGSWNAWQEVATKSEFYTKEEVDSLVGKSLGMKATGSERTRASGKYNYGL